MDDMMSHVFTPVVVQVGQACLAAHCFFLVLFAYILPKGPWADLPSFTAHQAVCLPLMIYLTYQGFVAWFGDYTGVENDAMVHILQAQERGSHISQVVLGMMLFWDIPVGLATPALRDAVMLAHHIGMVLVSGVGVGIFSGGVPVGTYYVSFFFGVIELSSIPLVVVDFFHPKHKAWFDFLNTGNDKFKGTLRSINELARISFALAFLAIRAIYFPYVQVVGAIPDFSYVASLPEEERQGISRGILYGTCVFAALFSLLQMYWGFLVARQVLKALGLAPSKAKNK